MVRLLIPAHGVPLSARAPWLARLSLMALLAAGAGVGCHSGPPGPGPGAGGSGGGAGACSSFTGEVAGTFGGLTAIAGADPLAPRGAAGADAAGADPDGSEPLAAGGFAGGDEHQDQEEFRAWEEWENATLQWGSQLGMGLPVALRLDGAADQCTGVDLELNIDDAPIGLVTLAPPALRCIDGALYLDGMIMVDVGMHPTVTSVAQLDGRGASVRFVARQADQVLASGELPIILHL